MGTSIVSNGCQNIIGQSKSTDDSREIDQRRNDIVIISIRKINLLKKKRREPKSYESDLKLQGHEMPLMIGSFLQETTADL